MADIQTEATYRIIRQADNSYGVEVTITDMCPTMVTPFPSQDSAQAWIDKHTAARSAVGTAKSWRRRR